MLFQPSHLTNLLHLIISFHQSLRIMLSIRSIILTFILFTAAEGRVDRNLAGELIAGYDPNTIVFDQNAIDLDQKAFNSFVDTLTTGGVAAAKMVYELGGNSATYAELSVILTVAVPAGTTLIGKTATDIIITGTALEAAGVGATKLKFKYDIGATQATHLTCKVGGLNTTVTSGCLASGGLLSFASNSIAYSYDPASANKNGRTMQGFSKSTDIYRVGGSGNYHADFQKYVDYYGSSDFADKMVLGSLSYTAISLKNGNWNVNLYKEQATAEFAKKASANLLYPLVVASKLEAAVEKCSACSSATCEAIGYLDEAVAYYAGSSEGTSGNTSGYLQYELHTRRCSGFRTCGAGRNETTGMAFATLKVFELFNSMKAALLGKKCDEAAATKKTIISQSFVGCIQGAMRYAYRTAYQNGSQVAEAEGAAFTSGILPLVAACNKADADLIFQNIRPGQNNTANFPALKAAYERNYACLGIKCSDIGGLYNSTAAAYLSGFEPCVDVAPVTAPVAAPVTAPVAAPVSSPVASPVGAPVAAAAPEKCGLLGLSIFCLSGCGLFKRLLGIGGC